LHEELRAGLLDQGHQVVTGCVGQGNPSYPLDIPFYKAPKHRQNRFGWSIEIMSQLMRLPRLTGFDIVQLISPKFFHWKVQKAFVGFLKRFNKGLVVINTGCTTGFNQFVRELAFSPCGECKLYDQPTHECVWERDEERLFEHWMYERADAIVSTEWQFERALATTPYFAKNCSIGLPIDTRRHRLAPPRTWDKVRIYYGETRYGYKGGKSISNALAMLEASSYADKVEIIRTPRIPFDDYLALLDRVDIVLDQSNSHCFGMNTLYASARGKVSFTGAAPETIRFFGVPASESPFVNIGPDAEDIYRKLVHFIETPAELGELGAKARDFAVRCNDARHIAQLYTRLYQQILERKGAPSHADARRNGRSMKPDTAPR
jgi:hypothetical protein